MTKTETKHSDYDELPKFHVLIAAAGSGQRMGAEIPKQYLKIHGKTVLRWGVEAFLTMPECLSIRVIINPDDANLYHDAVMGLDLSEHVTGDKERKLSISNGLKSLSYLKDQDIILVHDGARPLISKNDISNLLSALKADAAASLAVPASSTLRYANDDNNADKLVDRKHLWAMQTPQGFRYGDLLKAHEQADPEKNYTDDTALVSALNLPVKLVKGSQTNIKITHQQDLIMAEKLLQPQQTSRSGSGFDVHAFDTSAPGPVRICGIDIEHNRALKGHSDADVGLHAITDALLGAMGEGDIGQHFPPSNSEFKDMDSAIFLKKALEMLTAKNGQINNIDLTVICEEPKIGPHAPAMRARVSEILSLDEGVINIKATTTEGLGFTGRKEGIAAQALATITMPSETS